VNLICFADSDSNFKYKYFANDIDLFDLIQHLGKLPWGEAQPRRVGSFSGGPANLQGHHIFLYCGIRAEGASTYSGGRSLWAPPTLQGWERGAALDISQRH